jgi:hypothetical protein
MGPGHSAWIMVTGVWIMVTGVWNHDTGADLGGTFFEYEVYRPSRGYWREPQRTSIVVLLITTIIDYTTLARHSRLETSRSLTEKLMWVQDRQRYDWYCASRGRYGQHRETSRYGQNRDEHSIHLSCGLLHDSRRDLFQSSNKGDTGLHPCAKSYGRSGATM